MNSKNGGYEGSMVINEEIRYYFEVKRLSLKRVNMSFILSF